METIEHILFHCQFAKEVWNHGLWTSILDTSVNTPFFGKLQSSGVMTPLLPYGIVGNAFPWFCWMIWIARNQLLFEKRPTAPIDTACKAILAQKEWEAAQTLCPTKNPRATITSRPPPICDQTVLCNTDASSKADLKMAGLGWIFTNTISQELGRGSIAQENVASACMGEALAIREALLQTASLNYYHICNRTDSQVLVRAITSRWRTTVLFGVLADIDDLAFSTTSLFVSCCFRFFFQRL